jgi:hypothetical protein
VEPGRRHCCFIGLAHALEWRRVSASMLVYIGADAICSQIPSRAVSYGTAQTVMLIRLTALGRVCMQRLFDESVDVCRKTSVSLVL